METLSYEKRIELGNLVPALGQFKVMEKIPQYQQCEVRPLCCIPKPCRRLSAATATDWR